MKVPLLFFAENSSTLIEALDSYYDGPPADIAGPSVLNAWRQADLFSVKMLGMSHPEFCSMCQRRKTAESYAEDEVADYGRDDTNMGYAWVARYTLEFLSAYLKSDTSAKAFLIRNPAENGVPGHTMGVTFRAAGTLGKEHTR